MFRLPFTLTGAEEAAAAITRIAKQIGSGRTAFLEVSDRTASILYAQQNQGRDVLSWTDEEADSLLRIANVHLERAAGANSKADDGEARAEAMWAELGGYYRDRIAAKINDRVNIPKRELSDNPPGRGYASQKRAKWGGHRPILVASGAMRDEVKDAPVVVRKT